MNKPPPDDDQHNRIVAVTLDEESIGRSGPDIEHERAIAIYDLIEQNLFAPEGADGKGPFTLHIGITGSRLMFDIRREDGTPVVAHLLSLTPFRRIVKDYFTICESYYEAIRSATPSGSRQKSGTPARSSSARIRPRPSAITSPAQTTCCRRRVRRGFRPGLAC